MTTTAARPKMSRLAARAKRGAESLKMIADEKRLHVLLILAQLEEVNVGALCDMMELQQPNLSAHLAILRHGGIIEGRRSGKQVYYRLTGAGTELARVAGEAVN